jgi:hypothetical protein
VEVKLCEAVGRVLDAHRCCRVHDGADGCFVIGRSGFDHLERCIGVSEADLGEVVDEGDVTVADVDRRLRVAALR